jgi:hypothetical protein
MVLLCPPASAEWASFRVLDKSASTAIVDRLNNLSETPPSPACITSAVQDPVDLVLRAGSNEIVIRLDTGSCGSAQHDGAIRYGANELYRYTAELLAD